MITTVYLAKNKATGPGNGCSIGVSTGRRSCLSSFSAGEVRADESLSAAATVHVFQDNVTRSKGSADDACTVIAVSSSHPAP